MAKKDNSALAWLIGLGTLTVAGVGIYFYEKSQPPAPTTAPGVASQTVTLPGTSTPVTYAQAAQIAAQTNGTTLAAWQSGGIPAATWAQISPQIQNILTQLGYHANAT
jgi:hypothetical protein